MPLSSMAYCPRAGGSARGPSVKALRSKKPTAADRDHHRCRFRQGCASGTHSLSRGPSGTSRVGEGDGITMSDLITLTSDDLRVTLSPKGAELRSVQDRRGREWLWQGDPASWPRTGSGPVPSGRPLPGRCRAARGRLVPDVDPRARSPCRILGRLARSRAMRTGLRRERGDPGSLSFRLRPSRFVRPERPDPGSGSNRHECGNRGHAVIRGLPSRLSLAAARNRGGAGRSRYSVRPERARSHPPDVTAGHAGGA